VNIACMQVGDDVMVYLLKYTSIFLPLPHKEHHQVAGPPISNLCLKLLKQTSKSQYQHTSLVQFGN
jgi:telomerase reverse transcriptase